MIISLSIHFLNSFSRTYIAVIALGVHLFYRKYQVKHSPLHIACMYVSKVPMVIFTIGPTSLRFTYARPLNESRNDNANLNKSGRTVGCLLTFRRVYYLVNTEPIGLPTGPSYARCEP